jgi:RNA polymerase sigma factor (sigma-70 family)
MASARASILVYQLRGLVAAQASDRLPDRELLKRFTDAGEESAFTTLVRRHGPLVLGVCRRVLHHWHDAEDAFQATFLVLARKAKSIAKGESLGSWLYKVAYRVSIRARGQAQARQAREQQAGQLCPADPLAEITGRELLTVLDDELQLLPERYRTPLVLHYLQGKARDKVAQQLGWSLRTVRRRLAQGRECLRTRLKRRHLELPGALLLAGLAQGAKAGPLPPALVTATARSAVQTMTETAAAIAATPAAQLAVGMLSAMSPGKVKPLVVLVLATITAAAGWFAFQGGRLPAVEGAANTLEPPVKEKQKTAAAPVNHAGHIAKKTDHPRMAITGRVLDPAGKVVPGARVVVLVREGIRLSSWENWAWYQNKVLGRATADKAGRYRLDVRQAAAVPCRQVWVVAAAKGLGLGWHWVEPSAAAAKADVQLSPQQVLRGRLVGLQGEPARAVKVRVTTVTRKSQKGENGGWLPVPTDGLPLGLATATTDRQGHFALTGFGAGQKLQVEIKDNRYALQDGVEIDAGNKEAKSFRLVLPPPLIVQGQVTYADTGKPAAHARLEIQTAAAGGVSGHTDAAGRYRINAVPFNKMSRQFGKLNVWVNVLPPEGQPYLSGSKEINWPQQAVVQQTADVALPRGVVVHGRITEAASGQGVPRTFVMYNDRWAERVQSRPDGAYQITVPAGKGRLLVVCATPDYIPQVIGSAGGVPGKPIGDPMYYHAVAELDIKPGERKREVPITLHRGVTLKGRLVGPDNKPVMSAVMFIAGHRPPSEKTMSPVYLRGGHFEVHGCDPAKTYRLTFLQHPHQVRLMMGVESIKGFGQLWLTELLGNKDRLGAVAHLSAAKAAGKPVVVRMAPCGSVKLRFRDAAGKPVANYTPWLQLVIAPGPTIYEALERKTLAAEVITLAGRYGEPKEPHSDAKGFLTYQGLIPGAVYRVKKTRQEPRNDVLKDFTVEAGKTAEVDIVVK